jgi:hypothetical protein
MDVVNYHASTDGSVATEDNSRTNDKSAQAMANRCIPGVRTIADPPGAINRTGTCCIGILRGEHHSWLTSLDHFQT